MFTDVETTKKRRSARLAKMRERSAAQPSPDGGHVTPAMVPSSADGKCATTAGSKRRRLVIVLNPPNGTLQQASTCSSRAVLAQQTIQDNSQTSSVASPSLGSRSVSHPVPFKALDAVGNGSGSISRSGSITNASSRQRPSFEKGVSNNSRSLKANFNDTASFGVRGHATERWLLPRFAGLSGMGKNDGSSASVRWSRPDPHCPSLGPSARLLPWPGWPNAPDPLGALPVALLDSTSEHHIQCDGCGEWFQVHSQVIIIYREAQNLAFFCRYLTGTACRGDFRNPPGVATKNMPTHAKKKLRKQHQ